MFGCREGTFLNFSYVFCEAFLHHFSSVGEMFYEFWLKVRKQRKHVLIYEDLTVAAGSGSYTDSGNRYRF